MRIGSLWNIRPHRDQVWATKIKRLFSLLSINGIFRGSAAALVFLCWPWLHFLLCFRNSEMFLKLNCGTITLKYNKSEKEFFSKHTWPASPAWSRLSGGSPSAATDTTCATTLAIRTKTSATLSSKSASTLSAAVTQTNSPLLTARLARYAYQSQYL